MKHTIDNVRRSLIQTFASRIQQPPLRTGGCAEQKTGGHFQHFQPESKRKKLAAESLSSGLMLLPASGDQPMTEEAYGKLTQEQKTS